VMVHSALESIIALGSQRFFCFDVLWLPGVIQIVVAFTLYQTFVVYDVCISPNTVPDGFGVCHLRDLDRRLYQTTL
jgi:hypothetical protein